MTRVLTVTNWYPPHHSGGYEVACYDVTTRLAQRGHDVRVLCCDDRIDGAPPVPDPDHEPVVHRELRAYFRDGAPWKPPFRERLEIERWNHRTLDRHLHDFRPDVAAVWHMGALSLGLLRQLDEAGIPIVYSVCDDWLTYGEALDAWSAPFVGGPLRRLAGRAVETVARVPTTCGDLGANGAFCFISESTRTRAVARARWWFARSAVVYSGIDRSLFLPPEGRDEQPWQWRLLYVGRLDPRKGVETAIDALRHLPEEATLVCDGRGSPEEQARVVDHATSAGVVGRLKLTLTPRDQLARQYAEADAVVFPSEWEEPFGLVPVEAMACGTPVVATGTGGSGEFLRDGANCLRFPAGDAAALAAAVRRLAAEPELRRRLEAGGLTTAAQLEVEILVDALEEWLTAAANGFPAGAPPSRHLALPGDTDALDPLGRHRTVVPAVVAGGDAEAIKRLYVDLGDDWWSARDAADGIPVLSAPETLPVVARSLAGVSGRVLDAGCGPNPALSVALARDSRRDVIALDIGWGTVRVARELAAGQGALVHGVVGDVERLPFRDSAFDAIACDDTIEHLPDDAVGVGELARVLGRGGRGVLATPNRAGAQVVRAKLRDRARGAPKPARAYYCSDSHLREYTWPEFERLTSSALRVRGRHAVGWDGGRKARIASALIRIPPLRRFSQMIVLEVERR